jgi:hypothetical protein
MAIHLKCTIAICEGNFEMSATISVHVYEIRPRKDHRGVDVISDALPFGRL